MFDSRIGRLYDLKGQLVDQQRALVDEAEARATAHPDDPVAQRMTAEEHEQFGRIDADLSATIEEIRQLEAAAEQANTLSERDERAERVVIDQHRRGGVTEPVGPSDEDQWQKLLRNEMRSAEFTLPAAEQRIQTVGTTTAGGDTVPTSFVAELQSFLYEMSPIRQVARIVPTDSGNPLVWPRKTAAGSALLEGETDTIAASDLTVDQITLNAYKYARMTYVSNELATDSGINILGVVAEDLGQSIGTVTGAAYATGTGTAQPDGYVTNAASSATLAGATPTADELITHFFSITQPYRQRATWIMNDATALAVRLLKDGNGQYMWQPGIQVGTPDVILGRPVLTDHNMPTGSSAKVVVFGDMSRFLIRDVNTVQVARSDDFKFDTDLISFRVVFRTDSDITDTTGAIKSLTSAA